MTNSATTHTRMTHPARRASASSVARVPQARFAPCVLDSLGRPRHRAHTVTKAVI